MRPANKVLVPYFVMAAGFSVAINVLLLVTPLCMLQIYDRVLTSGSTETLTLVSVAAIGLLAVFGFAEAARRKVMSLASGAILNITGRMLLLQCFTNVRAVKGLYSGINDLRAVENFCQQGLAAPFFDIPFTPLFILAMFLVHPLLGWLGVMGIVLLALATLVTELRAQGETQEAQVAEQAAVLQAQSFAERHTAIMAHGLAERVANRWLKQRQSAYMQTMAATGFANFLSAHAKGLRLLLQISALCAGAWLILQQQVTAGAIVAGSILLGRALAPIDQVLGAWRQITRFREAWINIAGRYETYCTNDHTYTPLPRPKAELLVNSLVVAVPGASQGLLPSFNLHLTGGAIVVVLGASGVGKSSLLNALAGVWPADKGHILLEGRDLQSWPSEDRGRYQGYAAQEPELLAGSVAENISRFAEAGATEVIDEMSRLGYHENILGLRDGYDTAIDLAGGQLSRGQQQMINLARAFYGDPVLLCLDEPSAHLDQVSFEQLKRNLVGARQAGAIVVLVTHDMRLIECADDVLLLNNGTLKMVSARDYSAALPTVGAKHAGVRS